MNGIKKKMEEDNTLYLFYVTSTLPVIQGCTVEAIAQNPLAICREGDLKNYERIFIWHHFSDSFYFSTFNSFSIVPNMGVFPK